MITTINGLNRILFKNGKLFLNDIQIGGEDLFPNKEIRFEFQVNKPTEKQKQTKDPSILEVNVHDSIKGVDKGPGQKG